MRTIIYGIKAELLKLKNSYLVFGALLLPIIYLYLMFIFVDWQNLFDDVTFSRDFSKSLLMQYSFYIILILPFAITLIPSNIMHIEIKNNMLNSLKSMPYSQERIFVSKLILALMIISITLIVLFAGLIVGFYLINSYTSYSFDISIEGILRLFSHIIYTIPFLIPGIAFQLILAYYMPRMRLDIIIGLLMAFTANILYIRDGIELFFIPQSLPLIFVKNAISNNFFF